MATIEFTPLFSLLKIYIHFYQNLEFFSYEYVEINREELNVLEDYKQFLRILPSDNALLYDFVSYAAKNGVPARWYYINQSKNLIVTQLKALIARDIFGTEAFYPIYNKNDKMIQKAVKAFNDNKASLPIKNTDIK